MAVQRVPERAIPVPTTISPEAQAFLAMGPLPVPEYPALHDNAGWHNYVAAVDNMMLQRRGAMMPATDGPRVERIDADGVPVYVINRAEAEGAVYLDLHGGAFIVGGGEICRITGVTTAQRYGVNVWSVDYRMPPDHPYPAALDDCLVAYRELLRYHDPERIFVGGVSAGANLAAAVTLRARDEGLPLPAGVVLLTPALDLTRSGDTHRTNLGVDTILQDASGTPLTLYAAEHDPRHPYLSPLHGDFTLGFSPTLLASGTRDLLLSDAVRMHRALRAASISAELHVLEAAPHGFFGGTAPEDEQLHTEVRRFVAEHTPADLIVPAATHTA